MSHGFFLWDYVNNTVNDLNGHAATAAVEAATEEMLKCEGGEVGCRLDICHEKKCTDVEIFCELTFISVFSFYSTVRPNDLEDMVYKI
jgi:hypothetical protein